MPFGGIWAILACTEMQPGMVRPNRVSNMRPARFWQLYWLMSSANKGFLINQPEKFISQGSWELGIVAHGLSVETKGSNSAYFHTRKYDACMITGGRRANQRWELTRVDVFWILAGLCATILTVYHGALFSGGECIYVPRTLWGENIKLRYRAESVTSRHNEASNITANSYQPQWSSEVRIVQGTKFVLKYLLVVCIQTLLGFKELFL